jgi:threonylcarbamoyladenosine tRNA methylthiotransferase MtaB
LEAILGDIDRAACGGAQEVVLTGVQLGAWGRDGFPAMSLADLLERVLSHGGFARLRLSSIEPWDFEPSLLRLWKDKRLCRHLHIPLQSGHDTILKAMGRPINTEVYRKLIEQIRTAIPGAAITTDVIAGFPGETVEYFKKTMDFVASLGFAGGHVFTFSPRQGTAAYKMKDLVPVAEARARNAAMRQVFREAGREFRGGMIGARMDVLWETSQLIEDGSWKVSGLTDNYQRVHAVAGQDMWNKISRVLLQTEMGDEQALAGVIVEEE